MLCYVKKCLFIRSICISENCPWQFSHCSVLQIVPEDTCHQHSKCWCSLLRTCCFRSHIQFYIRVYLVLYINHGERRLCKIRVLEQQTYISILNCSTFLFICWSKIPNIDSTMLSVLTPQNTFQILRDRGFLNMRNISVCMQYRGDIFNILK